jgi:hypothetical protein
MTRTLTTTKNETEFSRALYGFLPEGYAWPRRGPNKALTTVYKKVHKGVRPLELFAIFIIFILISWVEIFDPSGIDHRPRITKTGVSIAMTVCIENSVNLYS